MEENGNEIFRKLGFKGRVVIVAYGKVLEAPPSLRNIFLEGQTSLVRSGQAMVIEENWVNRGRKYWRGLLAQIIAEASVPPPEISVFEDDVHIFSYKVARLYQIHSLLVSKDVLDALEEIEDSLDWRLKYVKRVAHIFKEKIDCKIFLIYIIGIAAAWPYIGISSKVKDKVMKLLEVLPKDLYTILVETLESGNLEEIYERVSSICGLSS